MSAAAERHRRLAGGFAAVVDQVDDWSAPAPVSGWAASDVVEHLVSWSRAFLAAGGIELRHEASSEDFAAAWHTHALGVQELLDAASSAEPFTHPYVGTAPLDETVDRFYSTDVLMHTWDLAEAIGAPSGLDPDECASLLEQMVPIEEMLRQSGQYGPAAPVAAGADGVVRLMGFVGRDPGWRAHRNA